MSEENKSTIEEAVALTDEALDRVAGGFTIGSPVMNPKQKYRIGQLVQLSSGGKFYCKHCASLGLEGRNTGIIRSAIYYPGEVKSWEGVWFYGLQCPVCTYYYLSVNNNDTNFGDDDLAPA